MWKKLPIDTRYRVSKDGKIMGLDGRIMKQAKDTRGYMFVTLNNNYRQFHLSIHRAVAMCYIPNPHNLPQVNHKDQDKTNNNVENLEWCTAKENQWHSLNILKNDPNITKKRPILCVDTGEVFPSIREAQRVYGKNAHIWEAASGRRKKAANKKWMFIKNVSSE